MITFKQFLAEEEKTLVEILKDDCLPFLKESGFRFLVRGVRGLSEAKGGVALDPHGKEVEYAVKAVRQDRKPLDMTRERQAVVDNWFEKKFGYRARSQAMFAGGETMKKSDLHHYGTPCVVVPIGPIEYVWSPQVADVYNDLDIYSDYDDEDNLKLTDEGKAQRIIAWLDKQKFIKTDLDKAAQLPNEVMVKCSSYYAFPYEYMANLKQAAFIIQRDINK